MPGAEVPGVARSDVSRESTSRGLGATAPAERHRPDEIIAGKYRLVRLIGDGGMGEVWVAQHLVLGVEVAVKLTRPALLGTAARARLVHEARVLARLSHPSIVRVLDSGTSESGFPFMVMELLRGPSLRQTIAARGRLSPQAAARILLPVASALATAHEHGVVHRDLKPDNIILVPETSGALLPKVFDFGIATSCAPAEEVFVEEGTLVGSPEYMSPEQALGGTEIDARTDVWAFCVLFHELCTGRSPFWRPTVQETLRAVAFEAAPPPPLSDDLALSSILARGLARDRQQRWPTMRELGQHLAAWAVRAGIEEDAADTSLRSHWFGRELRPLSDVPAPLPAAPRRAKPRSALRAVAATLAACLLAATTTAIVRAVAGASAVRSLTNAATHAPDPPR
jgi:serine/threonine protein kinase